MYNIKFKALSKRGYFTLLALLIAITSFAQEITINGVVIDETDTPLIGATAGRSNCSWLRQYEEKRLDRIRFFCSCKIY